MPAEGVTNHNKKNTFKHSQLTYSLGISLHQCQEGINCSILFKFTCTRAGPVATY